LAQGDDAAQTAGRATVFDTTHDAFSLPMPGLSEAHHRSFFVGNSFFNQNWVSAPSTTDTRDGLGPLFNTRSCSACHFKDGRGRPPEPKEPMRGMLLRISIPGVGPHAAPLPDPIYGDQLQTDALPGLPPEAEVTLEYEERPATLPDGERYSLRAPRYRIAKPGYGALAVGLLTSPRTAPAMLGLGLLEAIAEADIMARVDPQDRDHDGISGRDNRVWDLTRKQRVLGRFGWKAEQPSVRQQTAAAFVGDMGITSTLFESENHSAAQTPCTMQPSGGSPEIDDVTLEHVTRYVSTLGVPARRNPHDPRVQRGARLFERIGCASCHVPTLYTGPVAELTELSELTLHPYTDLLLHDMGDGLADHRPSFAASGSEWRTAPLWGLGLVEKVNGHTLFLHDGRARNVLEAVLWHAGEATLAQQRFAQLTRSERQDLLMFVATL
jgi:CxxC motif-containing protein (DUF1111 family)